MLWCRLTRIVLDNGPLNAYCVVDADDDDDDDDDDDTRIVLDNGR